VPAARIEAHGGYLVRAETLEGVDLQALARDALEKEGVAETSVGLLVSTWAPRKLVRLAYDAPYTYGRQGARWYRGHHALAEALSRAAPLTVHAYVFDPDLLEGVVTYGGGARVGGETLVYDELDLDLDELSDAEFEAARDHWPLGRLAQLLGLTRGELLRLPYAQGELLSLDGAKP